MTSPPAASVLAPALPEKRSPQSFPIVAAIAPVIMGLVIWAVTQSLLSLLFAGLGPLIAIGSLVDGRVQSRRTAAREAARFDRELAAARDELRVAHDEERRMLARASPSAAELVVRTPATRWSAPLQVRLGSGPGSSSVSIAGAAPASRETSREHALLAALCADARVLDGAPVVVDASGLIVIVGTSVAGRSLYRALALQLAAVLAPDVWSVAVGPGAETWISVLPHRVLSVPESGIAFVREDGASIRLEPVARSSDIPVGSAVVVVDDGRGFAAEIAGQRLSIDSVDRVSAAQALAWALRCAAEARERGLGGRDAELPESVAFASLGHCESDGTSVGTSVGANVSAGVSAGAAIGRDGTGEVRVDLFGDGPHAVIGGTTGSGKSELLITWVLALAAGRSPEEVTFLLVDFKGGATFGSIAHLPHCVGLLTDLDTATAERAFESLAAEVRFREAALTAQGVRDISEASELPRLVIVVDEFAALAAASPHLHALFADLAARGRSLGIHLILCTQRPAGIVRDAVLANVGIRLSLRVHDRADSIAVIATPDAAALPAHPRGRAYLSLGGAPPRLLQLALAVPADIVAVVERWPNAAPPRRPWCEPLPTIVPIDALQGAAVPSAIVLGRADHPHEQSQPIAAWSPATDGSILVVGAARSGKSTALETIAAGAPGALLVRGDPLATWDVVSRALDDVRRGGRDTRLVILDDLDVSIDRLGAEHASVLLERLQSLVREGPAAGIHCAISVQRVTGAVQPLLALCGSRLLLRLADRQEHIFAGGVGGDFVEHLPPGRGVWRGRAVQVASGGAAISRVSPDVTIVRGAFVAVAANPAAFIASAHNAGLRAERLDASSLTVSSGESRCLVGDVDEWQSQWGLLPRLRQNLPLIVDGCTPAEYRAVTKQRELPPPLPSRPGQFWVLDTDGSAGRGTFAEEHLSE